MRRTVIIGAMAAAGAFAAVLIGGRSSSTAAEEIHCRVNVPAFLSDLRSANGLEPDVNADQLKKLLKPKP